MGKKVTTGTHMPHVEGLVTIHKNWVGHVDIKLESIGLDFSLMKIESNVLDFYEWSPALPRVACGSQLGPFFPLTRLTHSLQLSHPLFNSHNLLHSVTTFLNSHTLSHNTHLNNTLSQVMFYIYLYFSYVIYLLCYVFTILGIFFVS